MRGNQQLSTGAVEGQPDAALRTSIFGNDLYLDPLVSTTVASKKPLVPAFAPMVSLGKVIDQSMDQENHS